jgi:hypothetical protein
MCRNYEEYCSAAVGSFENRPKVAAPRHNIAVHHPASDASGLKCLADPICRTHVLAGKADENIQGNE